MSPFLKARFIFEGRSQSISFQTVPLLDFAYYECCQGSLEPHLYKNLVAATTYLGSIKEHAKPSVYIYLLRSDNHINANLKPSLFPKKGK